MLSLSLMPPPHRPEARRNMSSALEPNFGQFSRSCDSFDGFVVGKVEFGWEGRTAYKEYINKGERLLDHLLYSPLQFNDAGEAILFPREVFLPLQKLRSHFLELTQVQLRVSNRKALPECAQGSTIREAPYWRDLRWTKGTSSMLVGRHNSFRFSFVFSSFSLVMY